MKKRLVLVCAACALSFSLLLTGCGKGKGAEDTGEDGKVAGTSSTAHSTTKTSPTTNGNLMDKAEDLVEDILPGGNPSSAATTGNNTTMTNK